MSTKLKAAAYDLAPYIDAEVRATLFDSETKHDLTDVVRKLRDSHTPGWIYYYLNEVETPANLGSGLANLIGTETVNDVAKEYAESDAVRINLVQPGAHNWMSDDPLAPVRNRYEEKREAIGGAIATAYADAFGDEFPILTDDVFQQWFKQRTLDRLNLLQWAVHEQEATDRGADDPTEQVADWWVARTRGYKLVDAIATYKTKDDDLDTYLEEKQHSDWENDHYVDVDWDADEPEIPLRTAVLPSRDVSVEDLRERIDDEDDE